MELINLHSQEFFDKQKIAGNCVAECLEFFQNLLKQNIKINLLDIELECQKIIQRHNCSPTFYKYKGFPGKVCLSVNNELVHGIPKDYILQNGDVVKLDLGATFEGAIADAAKTSIYGEAKKYHIELMNLCEQSLNKAIESIKTGNRIGSIGFAIEKCVKDSKLPCSLITNYGGHFLSLKYENDQIGIPHASPFISNSGRKDQGVRFQSGMTFAIEPMICIGNGKTKTLSDNWTVITEGIGFHFEDTIQIHENKIEIITRKNG
jgi:methionyl aminopeptidase